MKAEILVADDDPALLEMMSLTLRKEGYSVRTAATAERGAGAVRPSTGSTWW